MYAYAYAVRQNQSSDSRVYELAKASGNQLCVAKPDVVLHLLHREPCAFLLESSVRRLQFRRLSGA